jgi:5-methylcytosine-specific restriction enzyme A
MARTHGHGNPNWTRDETILALALYFASGKAIPSRSDSRVHGLSELLRSLPYHSNSAKNESFRNPDGVAFKLQNIHNVATGKGLGNVSEMDRQIWTEFGLHPDKVDLLAGLIRAGVTFAETMPETVDADNENNDEFYEGRLLTVIHKRRERDPNVRKKLLISRKKAGKLVCDLCSQSALSDDPAFEDASFEAHHVLPISMAMERITRIADLALLCANCHRLIHRAISIKKRWLSITECKSLLISPDSHEGSVST